MSIILSPAHFDTANIGAMHPTCMLLTIATTLCDKSNFMSPYHQDFPIQFKFNQELLTSHCRHHPMAQIVCRKGHPCPKKVTCNLKMNGSRKFHDWTWDCNTNNGSVHFESCYGNKDTSCINVGSFHFRKNNAPGPVKLHLPPSKTDINSRHTPPITVMGRIISAFKAFIAFVKAVIVFGAFASTVYVLSTVFRECFGEFGLGLLIGGMFFAASSDSSSDCGCSWFDTEAVCDD